MNTSKSPRIGAPPRRQSSKSRSRSPLRRSEASDSIEQTARAGKRKDTATLRSPVQVSQPITHKIASVFNQDAVSIEAMKRKMSAAMAQKQQAKTSSLSRSDTESPELMNPLTHVESSSDESVATGTLSTDSAKTVRASAAATPSAAIRTPSYPFPRMALKLNRGSSHRSGPHHKPFTLLSPTNEPVTDTTPLQPANEPEPSDTSTPLGPASVTSPGVPDDPNYPTPDLYDIVLMLNAEPGLEAWWANVCEILSDSYGAERASLALPGDITDLENVPWGQKATYNIYGSDLGQGSAVESTAASELDFRSISRGSEVSQQSDVMPLPQRPPLLSRHSIAGPLPEGFSRNSRQRPPGPVRAISSINPPQEDNHPLSIPPRLTRQPATPRTTSTAEVGPSPKQFDSASASSALRCHVHRSLQPLETEADALLVRTGVSALFGKRKPVVLTRAYTEDARTPSPGPRSSSDDSRTHTSRNDRKTSTTSIESRVSGRSIRAFDEYEQPEPSPWTQSPSPSPAARPDPTESPFFAQPSNTVDETAFEQDPPIYDYGASANQSLNAIGADLSKTLIHVPLIQPVPARGVTTSTLRFPIAILSFLSPVTPYPRNLRHSLTHLLAHLASSFSMAQQYTFLQDRLRGSAFQKPGSAFGLGGTFSDEGSELELVAELSGQIAHEKRSNTYASSGMIRESTESSIAGTPLHEHLGLSPLLATPGGRSGSEMAEGYFSAKRIKGKVSTPGERRVEETPVRPKSSAQKPTIKTNIRTSAGSSRSQLETVPHSPKPGSQTSESDYGDSSFMSRERFEARKSSDHRESLSREGGEKPLPELIASLMLNAVPLQLFLAKPAKGDLVWTNRKFDAFRSQGEGRVRDPWKNVHPADRDGLVKLWEDALKSGSQFTHYIRVKRFNSDSDFRWFVFRASTLLSSQGRLLYWIGSFLDVHEQYIKNLAASEREATMARDAKIRALADAIPQIMFEAIEGEGIVSVNQQWQAYSGQSLDEARELGFARNVHRDDLHKCGILSQHDAATLTRPRTEDTNSNSSSNSSRTAAPPIRKTLFAPDLPLLERMISSGSVTVEKDENGRVSYLTEIRLRSRGGEYRWFLVRLSRVESALLQSGRASWYGTCTDIETRKILERQLNLANEKVRMEMESKTKFFANMSHEIRTPLNGILGSMPWLVDSALDHDQRRTVDTIQNSANNLRELVDNILDVTKVEAGKMTLVPKWFAIRTLCEEVVDTVSSRAIERGLELNYSLEATVPTTVRGDPFRVRQVLLNLLGNSVKFTEQGEVHMGCHLRDDPRSTKDKSTALLAFDVVDTGRGFNESDFQRLFKQFGQIGSGSNHEAGSGLGLFLSKQLVEMHGGELSVKSQAGEGSTFSFFIRVDVAPPGTEAPSPQPTGSRTRQRHNSSISGSSRSHSDGKTPTLASKQMPQPSGVIQTPGLSRYVTSPDSQSPTTMSPNIGSPPIVSPQVVSSAGSIPSARSNSVSNVLSSVTSLIPTPDSIPSRESVSIPSDRQVLLERAIASHPALKRSKSETDGTGLAPEMAHPATYSIVVICPAEHARTAIKQHIEHVVPLQIPVNVTTIPSIGSFLDLMNGPTSPTFTHIVLDLPAASDIMLFMRQMANFTAPILPTLVVVTDHYQKRDIQEDFQALTATGKKAFLIHKPVKPSVVALIFDPSQLRNLSKDRAREVAQTSSDDFRNIANMVKETIGNRSFRILLVDDSSVNRMVIVRYLKKVALDNDTAEDGQQCIDMVVNKPHSHYNLIICDIQMPRKNGYQACSEIRQWERDNGYQPTPILALTAHAMQDERTTAASAGFTDYLTKPVEFNLLGTMMVNLLDKRIPHTFLKDRPLES